MNHLIRPFSRVLLGALPLLLAACSNSADVSSSGSAPAAPAPADAPGVTNVVPPAPAAGTSRPGTFYNIYITAPGTGDKVAFTVFEPATFEGGKTYPLVLHSHGFSASRQTSTTTNPASSMLSPGNVDSLVAANYAVISIDERGHGESGGTIRVMDPDYEGKDLLAVLDWAEAKLPWLAYGPSADGRDPHNLIVGSIGGSYGGMYQYLIHSIDPKGRLDAMVPQIAPSDLNYSLFPNAVVKADWDLILFGIGNTAGSNLDRAHFDPYVTSVFTNDLLANSEDAGAHDFFGYHSANYFCRGQTIATNGGPGTAPEHAPVAGPKVNALIFQGMRDTLFTFNNAYENYQCLKSLGGDVRLLSYQYGHNALQVVPDVGVLLYQPPLDFLDTRCGTLDVDAATLAFFNHYLKGQTDASYNALPTQNCLSLTKGDAVLVPSVTTGHNGVAVDVPRTTVLPVTPPDVPVVVDLGIVAGANGDVIGGIPRLEIDIEPLVAGAPGEPFLFAGIGQMRASVPGVWDLIDNQNTPIRGAGPHAVDMSGIAERLSPGDKIALLLYANSSQYIVTGNINVVSPTLVPFTVSGKVWVPMLGNLPNAP